MKLKNVLKNNTISFKIGSVLLVLGTLFLLTPKITFLFKNKIEVLPTPVPTMNQKNIVTRVIDGDTIVLSTGEKVRYIGMDTPETENKDCFATDAAKLNSDMVLGKIVTITRDISDKDKYGRLLRYVYVDGVFVNDYLVKNGYAKVMSVPPDTKFSDEFVLSESYAKQNLLGLWGKCGK